MFRSNTTAVEPVSDVPVPDDGLVPIAVIALEWALGDVGDFRAFLAERGIEIREDDLARDAISRADARQLILERRAAEARRREAVARQEQAAVVADELRRSRIWSGIPASAHEGLSPAAAMLGADYERRPRRKNPIEEALADSTLTYHSYAGEQEAG